MSWSHTGFWSAQGIMKHNHGAGTIYYIGAGLWTLECLWSFYTLKSVYSSFRGKNTSLQQVKQEVKQQAVAAAV